MYSSIIYKCVRRVNKDNMCVQMLDKTTKSVVTCIHMRNN